MNVLAETEQTLKEEIGAAVIRASLATEDELPSIVLEKPREKSHGDFASNIAMQLARIAKMAPRKIAEDIVEAIDHSTASIERIEIAGPGFINFFMKDDYLETLVPAVLKAGDTYGQTNEGNGERVQVEFVSVNPTGRLHVGHARGAAYGDVLCNVLEASGYEVEREYYINDAGNQIDQLAWSINTRYQEALGREAEMPKDGYFGSDITSIGERLAKEDGETWLDVAEDERIQSFRKLGVKHVLQMIKDDLATFRVHFDHWFSEQTLYEDTQITDAIEVLEKGGYTYGKDGAVWFRSTDFADDKDRVLIKQDGTYTYLTPDIAYHKNKLDRGFTKLINVWGGDHHGYIQRMKAAIQALGYEENTLDIKVMQMVNILEKGEAQRMSKRSGNAIPLAEFLENVGVDAVRYFFIARSNDSQLDFDVELAMSESTDNPVYYVQYAHARICTMLVQAEKQQLTVDDASDFSLLTAEKEKELLTVLGNFPSVVADAARKQEPHQVTHYVFSLASALHSFYNAEKVFDVEHPERTKARIALMKAVQITLANALKLIGVSAPEKM